MRENLSHQSKFSRGLPGSGASGFAFNLQPSRSEDNIVTTTIEVQAHKGEVNPASRKQTTKFDLLLPNAHPGIINWPARCACCGEATRHTIKVDTPTKGHSELVLLRHPILTSFDVPCCPTCAKHNKFLFNWRLWVMLLGFPVFGFAFVWIVKYDFGLGGLELLISFLGSLFIAIVFYDLLKRFGVRIWRLFNKNPYKPSCSCKLTLIADCDHIDPATGSYTFTFGSPEYAKAFREANRPFNERKRVAQNEGKQTAMPPGVLIDMREDDEAQFEQEAQLPLQSQDEELAHRLVQLLKLSIRQSRSDAEGYEATHKEIMEIGNTLCSSGGSDLMKKVAYRVGVLGGNTRLIEMHWDGICEWQY